MSCPVFVNWSKPSRISILQWCYLVGNNVFTSIVFLLFFYFGILNNLWIDCYSSLHSSLICLHKIFIYCTWMFFLDFEYSKIYQHTFYIYFRTCTFFNNSNSLLFSILKVEIFNIKSINFTFSFFCSIYHFSSIQQNLQ